MNFLINAFCDEHTNELLGVNCVEFNPDDDYTNRPFVRPYTLAEFSQAYKSMTPMGFMFDENGLLSADSNARTVVSSETYPFIYEQCAKIPRRKFDITDLLMFGVENSGATLINYSGIKEGQEPIVLPFSSYKVSGSSMNIYGAYRLPDGTFRTHSMLEMENGAGKTVYCVFPPERLGIDFSGFCEEIDTIELNGIPATVFKVDTTLQAYNVVMGEAFLNYLAFMVSYYNIGRKVLKVLAPAVESAQEKVPQTSEEREVRKVKENVSIVHIYDREYVDDVAACGSDMNSLSRLIAAFPEARVTALWMQKIFNSPWYDASKPDAGMPTVSANLAVECRKFGLKYGLELLTCRKHLMDLQKVYDSTPLILKGGGVDGQSAKRVSF